jgi:single-strand DNA-binding protein
MMDYNRVILAGRLCEDPELRTTAGGVELCRVRLAVSDGWGEKKKTGFYDLTVFGKRGAALARTTKKGDCRLFEGRLELQQWESDGQKRSKVAVIVDDWRFVDSKERVGDV